MDEYDLRMKKLARVLKYAEETVSFGSLLLITAVLCSFIPWSLLWSGPSSGGDSGSHYWPLMTLLDYAFPNGSLRTWNPGNLGGEPHLVHYFPLGFYVMALISVFTERAAAFNLGTLLPFVCLPAAVFFSVRLAGLKFPAPILAAVFSLAMLLNESYSMWGGNGLSLLAGQFAHAYALVFLLLGLGYTVKEIREDRTPLIGSFFFACVLLSHAYVGLGLVFVYGALWITDFKNIKRFLQLLGAGVFTFLLALWFIIPMVTNSPWTTPYAFSWYSKDILAEIFPPIFYQLVPPAALGIFALLINKIRTSYHSTTRIFLLVLVITTLGYTALYFIFPKIGLVDIRAVPQILLCLTIIAGILISMPLSRAKLIAPLITFCVVCGALYYTCTFVKLFPHWCKWNYSSWKAKQAYPDLTRLTETLKGTFSDPRVVYEHNMINNRAGTERVFEMLPYFSHRSTLESVYMQASILAPAAFLSQALVSKAPSCPYAEYPCPHYDLGRAIPILKELGVQDLILVTPELEEMAKQNLNELTVKERYGQWLHVTLNTPGSLVDIQREPLHSVFADDIPESFYTVRDQPISRDNWKGVFFSWLFNYPSATPRLIHPEFGSPVEVAESMTSALYQGDFNCKPTLDVSFGKLALSTPCPERLHILKFAYHPTWETNDGRRPLLVSPGYMAIVPHATTLELKFGKSWLWKLGDITSILSLLFLILVLVRRYGKKPT